MKVYLFSPYGYCEGVKLALANAVSFKTKNKNSDVYMLNPLVHNEIVNAELMNMGIKILDKNLSDINKIKSLKDSDKLILPAHGHKKDIDTLIKEKNIDFVDCICPLVKLEKEQILKVINENKNVLYIGKEGHAETETILSLSDKIIFYKKDLDLSKYFKDEINVGVQTTFNTIEFNEILNLLKSKFSKINIITRICNETTRRQENIKLIPKDTELIYIVGSNTSSNTLRLYEIARSYFDTLNIHIILSEQDIKEKEIKGKYYNCAIISSASTSKENIEKIKNKLEYLH